MAVERPGTVDDLLADARKLGHPVSRRLITDWVSMGLLDSPTRRGAGRGKGTTKGIFPARQRQLFEVLVTKRAGTTRVTHLTTIPVALWLYWGDDYVPFRQARRALETWVDAYERVPAGRARLGAKQLLAQLDHPDATDRDRARLRKLIEAANTSGGIADPRALHEAVSAVFDPHHEGRTLGPPGAAITPQALVTTAVMRGAAIDALNRGRVDEATFRAARADLAQTLSEYLALRPHLAAQADPAIAHLFAQPGWEQAVNSACTDLLLALGQHVQHQEPG